MTIEVFFEEQLVGGIDADANGAAFTYAESWRSSKQAFPISMSMPLSSGTAGPETFIPWAANLLPEGAVLRTISQLLGMAPEDLLALLERIGRDTAGALSIGGPGKANADFVAIETDRDLEKIIEELPRKPFLVTDEGVSMSLAGVQTKLGLFQTADGKLAVPVNGSPSTHILKPDADRLYGNAHNEAFCMTLAKLSGIAVADVTTGRAGDRNYLLVRRYDRAEHDGRWRRIHQEDFCQALGKPPEAKYERNQTGTKGPTAAGMLMLARLRAGATGVLNLLDLILFNVAVCNTDAHAKNYSLIIEPDNVRVAPGYDIVATQVWGGITPNLAQSIADKTRGDHLKRRHWARFAESSGLGVAATLRRIRAGLRRVEARIPKARQAVAAMPAGDHPMLAEVEALVRGRVQRLLNGLDDDSASD